MRKNLLMHLACPRSYLRVGAQSFIMLGECKSLKWVRVWALWSRTLYLHERGGHYACFHT